MESDRFDLYGALWLFCSRYHSGRWSTGYRILSRLINAEYSPGLSLQQGRFESWRQKQIYKQLWRNYRNAV